MNATETLLHIRELTEDAAHNPQYLTFHTIAEWCEKQMRAMTPCDVCGLLAEDHHKGDTNDTHSFSAR